MSRNGVSFAVRVLAAAVVLAVGSAAANAKCTKLGFSVNDYGKEGPTKDAMALLDKYIASWTAARGITKYSTGKKDVSCELFLDFGVFDEHTCKATATVCWTAPATAKPTAPIEKAPPKAKPSEAPTAPAPAKIKPKSA